MKKYLIFGWLIMLAGCSGNGFEGKKYKLEPVVPMMKAKIDAMQYTIIHNYTTKGEVEITTYNKDKKVVGTEKKKYKVDGSFLFMGKTNCEVRRRHDTVDLYNNGTLLFKLIPVK